MTDAAPDDAASLPTDGSAGPAIRVLSQFIRDLSFENPRAPDSLHQQNTPPAVDLGVEMNARGRVDGLFEVDIKLSLTAARDNEAVFHLELVYGGLFGIGGVSEQDIEAVLLIECPRYLFPYVRRLVSELTAEGGFYPPILLQPMDFAALYMQRQAAQNGQPAGHA